MTTREELEALTDWEQLSQEVRSDRRNNKRVWLACPVEVSGFDMNRRLFCERTVTQDISYTGCRFLLKTQMARGNVVAIRLLGRGHEEAPPGHPILFNVIWVAREEDGWVVGALMFQPEKFWHVEFPDKNNPPGARS